MPLKIAGERPPNFEKIVKAFPNAINPDVIFCYGDTIFNPSRTGLSEALLAHEAVHSSRQSDPEIWWDRYIADPAFRFAEELPAHAAEYRVAITGLGRPARRYMLAQIAQRLSGPLYGRVASFATAKTQILELSAA